MIRAEMVLEMVYSPLNHLTWLLAQEQFIEFKVSTVTKPVIYIYIYIYTHTHIHTYTQYVQMMVQYNANMILFIFNVIAIKRKELCNFQET